MEEERKIYPVICSYCKREYGTKEDLTGPSHGICEECWETKVVPELAALKEKQNADKKESNQ